MQYQLMQDYKDKVLDLLEVVTERVEDGRILSVLSFEVDGEKVKENTLYTLKNGQLEEVI